MEPAGTTGPSSGRPFRIGNKMKRKAVFVQKKKDDGKSRREERFRRKKDEDKNPELRRERLEKNQPASIDKKRVWDEGEDDSLGRAVNVAELKRRKLEREEAEAAEEAARREAGPDGGAGEDDEDEDVDSMLGSDDEDEDEDGDGPDKEEREARLRARRAQRAPSLAPSTTSTNLDLTPTGLAAKFPGLFSDERPRLPKTLITTSLNSVIHKDAQMLCTLFPNATYIPRRQNRFSYRYSVREIAKFASNRDYTALIVLREDEKKPSGMTIVHLPAGPTFTFTISNWVEGKVIPGHGNPTNHYSETLLSGFSTPLGILTGKLLYTLFAPQPEIEGRQVVSMQNHRDYVFIRRYRYQVRERRQTERSVTAADGKEMKGMEDIRVGLQELGPRLNIKLRRVDKGIGRAGSEGDDAVQWEWKAGLEKQRTRFNL